jgi:alpha-D-ribose 1-methylphosphonate 5-triphosphate diphosphatase PhnM
MPLSVQCSAILALPFALAALHAQTPVPAATQLATLAPAVAKYVKVSGSQVLLTHVRIIDGTGAAPLEDQSILIENGKITSISKDTTASPSTAVIDLHGRTVIPGLVGMHDHLYYIARPNETV